MNFLDRSEREQQRIEAEREAERRRTLRRTQFAAGVLAALLVMALVATWWAWRRTPARSAISRSPARPWMKRSSSASTDPATLGADVPEMVAFRRDLMRKAERFYAEFVRQEPNSEAVLSDVAEGHKRLGHINRIMGDAAAAEHHYHYAIGQFEQPGDRPAGRIAVPALSRRHLQLARRNVAARCPPGRDEADGGLRKRARAAGDAVEDASGRAPKPGCDLARTHYNRGILLVRTPRQSRTDAVVPRAEPSFAGPSSCSSRGRGGADRARLAGAGARVSTTSADAARNRPPAARRRPSALRARHPDSRDLMAREPGNREYTPWSSRSSTNNMADLLRERRRVRRALEGRTSRALDLLQALARPAPSIGIEQADAHTAAGRILSPSDASRRRRRIAGLTLMFEALAGARTPAPPNFMLRYGDLIANLAAARRARPRRGGRRRILLEEAVPYLQAGLREVALAGSRSEARP